MTRLTKPVTRVVTREHGDLVVSLEPPGILVFREKRTRKRYELGLGALFVQAVQADVEARRRSRRPRRQRLSLLAGA